MTAIAVVAVLFSVTAMMGGWLAFQFWTGGKTFKGASAVHLIIGAAGLEGLVLLLRGAPDGTRAPIGELGPYAAFGLAIAFMTGLFIPLIAKPKPGAATSAIIAHASVATVGLGALFIWLIRA
jgi:hypothetical protein